MLSSTPTRPHEGVLYDTRLPLIFPQSRSFKQTLTHTHTEQPPNTTVPAHTHLHRFDLLLHFHTFASHLLRFSVVLDTSDRAELLKELDLQVKNLLE